MAGYIGTKAVLLSTTAATVTGNADIGGDLTVDSNTLYVDSTNNNVGIGTSSPNATLSLGTTSPQITFVDSANTSAYSRILGTDNGSLIISADEGNAGAGSSTINFEVDTTEAMRIDSSGNLLVGKTSANSDNAGFEANSTGFTAATRSNGTVFVMDRLVSDGTIIDFRKDNTNVGSIATLSSQLYIGSSATSDAYLRFGNSVVRPCASDGANRDNVIDLGATGARFDDIYATNGTIQTSDRNEKQDIAELDEAEKRVAVAAKGLIRKYRWKDAVAEKGDEARIHVGIIAQDLQDAFAVEGLDAGRYAMFISSTWWEHDGQTYETAEEAPEGATERTRFGVRYPELLAFIIGAM